MPLEHISAVGNDPSATALWQRAYIGDRLQADDLTGIQDLANALGGGADYDFDFLTESWPPSYVVFRLGDQYEISLQGTSNIKQVVGHLSGAIQQISVPLAMPINGPWLIQAQLRQRRFERYLVGKPAPSSVMVSGHSYGGAVAHILAMLLSRFHREWITRVITFGSPRWGTAGPVLNPPLIEARVVNDDDIVPRLPPKLASPALVAPLGGLLTSQGVSALWAHRGQRIGVAQDGTITFGTFGAEEPNAIPEIALSVVGQAHVIAEYRRRLEASNDAVYPPRWQNGRPGPQVPSGRQQTQVAPAAPMDQTAVDAVNQQYYGTQGGPITVGNQNQVQSGGLIAGSPEVRFSANISGGKPVPAYSDNTKVTLVINNGRHGHTESHVVNQNLPAVVNSSPSILGAMLTARCPLLGNNQTAPKPLKSKGSPCVEYIRLTDANNPRLGQIIDYSTGPFFGPASTDSTGAQFKGEAFMKAVTVRMSGLCGIAPNPVRNTTLQIIGFPDDGAEGYDYLPGYLLASGNRFGIALRTWINFLAGLNPDGSANGNIYKFGFLGASPTQNAVPVTPAMTIFSIVPTTPPSLPNYIVTTNAANGILPGDHVRIRGANPVFNGVWKVNPWPTSPLTSFTFAKPPVSGHTLPNGGVVYRLQSSGVNLGVFYPYQPPPLVFPRDNYGNVQCSISKHDPGRQWLKESFIHRTRRER